MKSFNIITGEKGGGKTTRILSIASRLASPPGFVSIHRCDDYYMLDLKRRKERLLMSQRPLFEKKWRGWYVDTSLFDEVYEKLSVLESGSVYLDECGRMEMDGLGYDRTLRMLMERDVDIYITLRRQFLDCFLSHYSIVDYRLIPVEKRTEG